MTAPDVATLAAALHDAYCRQNVPMHRDNHAHDTTAIIAALAAQGWRLTDEASEADIHTVIEQAVVDAAVRATLKELRAEVEVLDEASFGAVWRGAVLDAINARLER